MKHFIDTNMALGYSFSCDKWHLKAIEFILKNDDIFWSNNVLEEFNRKYSEIYENIFKFLSKISILLTLNPQEFINYFSFEKYIINNTADCNLDKTKKIKIIEFFWEKMNILFSDSHYEFIFKFDSFVINYTSNHDLRKKELENIVSLHDCGLENYLKFKYLNKKLMQLGVHEPDNKIILDAHDLGKSCDLSFNTTDKKLHDKIKNCDILQISKYCLHN